MAVVEDPAKLTCTKFPPHKVRSGGSCTVGTGLTVMVNMTGVPVQLPIRGVTVMLATCWVLTTAAGVLIGPVPLAITPMLGLSFVQL